MADFIDDAQAVNELHQKVSLLNHQDKLSFEAQPGWEDFNGVDCVDCDEGIPVQRLAMRRIRCCPCQEHLERVQKADAIRGKPLDTDE